MGNEPELRELYYEAIMLDTQVLINTPDREQIDSTFMIYETLLCVAIPL